MARFSALVLACGLSACAAPAAVQSNDCPPVKAYSQSDQQSLKTALDALPLDNPLVGAMLDYEHLRDAARACAGQPAPLPAQR